MTQFFITLVSQPLSTSTLCKKYSSRMQHVDLDNDRTVFTLTQNLLIKIASQVAWKVAHDARNRATYKLKIKRGKVTAMRNGLMV